MYYDIRNVPYEYEQLKECCEQSKWDEALIHYKSMMDNYENADNEYIFSNFNSPITIESLEVDENGKSAMVEHNFPSINEMVRCADKMYGKIKRKLDN